MDIEALKYCLDNNKYPEEMSIFQYKDIDFLPFQYIKRISELANKEIEYIDSLDPILNNKNDLFGIKEDNNKLQVYKTKELDVCDYYLKKQTCLIIVCSSLSKEANKMYDNNITVFPKLEEWQIKDYVYSIAEGVDEKDLDKFIAICKNDIYRIDSELDKIRIFQENERKYVFKDFISNGIFNDLSEYSIFNFTNAIMKKDIDAITSIYKELDRIDCEPLGLVTILYNNIKDMIKVQLSRNPTPENTHINNKKFWAIKYQIGNYTNSQLIGIFSLLLSIDKMLKTGQITNDLIIDYVVCQIMEM